MEASLADIQRSEELGRYRRYGQGAGHKLATRTPSKAARKVPVLVEKFNPATILGAQCIGEAEAILQTLRAATRCRICGRELTDPVSVTRGIGPDCIAKLRREAELERTYREAMAAAAFLGDEEAGIELVLVARELHPDGVDGPREAVNAS